MMDDVTFLTKVRELLSDPERWTQHTSARNSNYEPCDTRIGRQFCWTGACYRVLFDDDPALFNDTRIETTHEMCAKITRVFGPVSTCANYGEHGEYVVIAEMVFVNDHQGYRRVMDLIEKALVIARSARGVVDLRPLLAAVEDAPLERGRPMAPA